MNSFKYVNINHCDMGIEDEHDANYKCSRFCPAKEMGANYSCKQISYRRITDCCRCGTTDRRLGSLTKMRSYVDVRSQQLQRSLMEEIHKRRMFKTVGAIENIGFQDPTATWRSGS